MRFFVLKLPIAHGHRRKTKGCGSAAQRLFHPAPVALGLNWMCMNHHSTTRSWFLPDEVATRQRAAALTPLWANGGVVFLVGQLGAGKTTFVRGLLAALGHRGPVKSPTYTLVESYPELAIPVYHFDFYRFADPEEFLSVGFDEYVQPHTLCLVEWPEKATPYLPPPDWTVTLTIPATGGRELTVTTHREANASLLATLP
jgi:tRNA threonylcarbamoyladenosine biosynthesis protein TsaE